MDNRIALVVAADEPAQLYTSINAAERAMEAVDVRDGVYTAAYGPHGEVYRISADDEQVRVVRDAETENRPDELRKLLIMFLEHGGDRIPKDTSLPALLAACEPYAQDY